MTWSELKSQKALVPLHIILFSYKQRWNLEKISPTRKKIIQNQNLKKKKKKSQMPGLSSLALLSFHCYSFFASNSWSIFSTSSRICSCVFCSAFSRSVRFPSQYAVIPFWTACAISALAPATASFAFLCKSSILDDSLVP